jgi:paraquat-inducible protein B
MKKLIWLLPLLIILGAMLVTVEMKSQTREVTINYDFNNLIEWSSSFGAARVPP